MAEQNIEMTDFIKNLVDEAWRLNPTTGMTRPYIKGIITDILRWNPVEFVVGLGSHLDRRDVTSILLSAPELWFCLGIDDWRRIVRGLSPKPDRGFADWSGFYSDIEFLALYLRIDPIAVACHSKTSLTMSDKRQVCQYCLDEADVLFMTAEDCSYLDGNLRISIEELNSARKRIIAEDESVVPQYSNAAELREYAIDSLKTFVTL